MENRDFELMCDFNGTCNNQGFKQCIETYILNPYRNRLLTIKTTTIPFLVRSFFLNDSFWEKDSRDRKNYERCVREMAYFMSGKSEVLEKLCLLWIKGDKAANEALYAFAG